MASTVDSKVVEMKFDNRDFEKNTKQSMATLDKLKASLDMSDSEKSLKSLSRASGDLSFGKASDSVDTFSVKLSALSAVAVSAIGRITNSLMDMGEQLLKNMTGIDQIREGFSKYEANVGYEQLMLSSSDTLTTEKMHEILDKLKWFSDETSFETSSMMNAMSRYMAGGADELTAQAAAIGTALWAALTGNSNESLNAANNALPKVFSRGMTREIWSQISTAKMDTPQMRKLFIETAKELGTIIETGEEGVYEIVTDKAKSLKKTPYLSQETFLDQLTVTEWLNKDVYLTAMAKLSTFTDDVYDEYTRLEELGKEPLTFDIIRDLGKVGDAMDSLGYKSLKNAQDTKTWTETWDYVKGTIASGWAESFEIVIGDFEQARDFFSTIVESMYELFITQGNARNELLQNWADYIPKTVNDAVDEEYDVLKSQKKVARSLKQVVAEVFNGKYGFYTGDTTEQLEALTKAFGNRTALEILKTVKEVEDNWDGFIGGDWKIDVSELDGKVVDKTIYAYTKLAQVENELAGSTEEETPLSGREDLLDGIASFLDALAVYKTKISDALADELGISPEFLYNITHRFSDFLRSFSDKAKEYEPTFVIRDLIKLFKELTGIAGDLLQPFKQVWEVVTNIFSNIDGFFMGPLSNLIAFLNNIRQFTKNFKFSEEQLQKIERIVWGVLEPLNTVWKVLDSVSRTVFSIFMESTGSKSRTLLDWILDIAAWIGDMLGDFNEWLDKTHAIDKVVVPLITFVKDGLSSIWGWIKKILKIDTENEFPTFEDILGGFRNAKNWIHKNIIEPFETLTGIDIHFPTWAEVEEKWGNFKAWVKKNIVEPFEEVTGIKVHWPSWEEIKEKWGKFKTWFHTNVVEPFNETTGLNLHWPTIEEVKDFFQKVKDFFTEIFNTGEDTSKAADSVEEQGKAWTFIGNVFGGIFNIIKKVFGYISELLSYMKNDTQLAPILKGGILAIILKFVSKIKDAGYDIMYMVNPLSPITALFEGISEVLYSTANKNNAKATKELAESVLMIAGAMLILTLLPVDDLNNAVKVVVSLIAALIGVMVALNGMSRSMMDKGDSMETLFGKGRTVKSYGMTILEIGAAVLLLAMALKKISKIKNVTEALFILESLLMTITGMLLLMQITSKTLEKGQKLSTVTIQFLSISVLILAMASAIKKLSKIKGLTVDSPAYQIIRNLLLMVEALIVTVSIVSSQASGKGTSGASMVAALLGVITLVEFLVIAMAIMSKTMDEEEVKKYQTIGKVLFGVLGGVSILILALAALINMSSNNNATSAAKQAPKSKANFSQFAGIAVLLLAIVPVIISVAIAISMLSKLDSNAMEKAAFVLMAVVAVLVVIVAAISNLFSGEFKLSNLGTMASVVGAIAALTLLVATALRILVTSTTDTGLIWTAAGAILAIVGAMSLIFAVLSKMNLSANMMQITQIFLSISLSTVYLALALTALVKSANFENGADTIWAAALSIVTIVGAFALILIAVSKLSNTGDLLSISASFLIFGIAVSIMAKSLSVLATANVDNIWASAGAISVLAAAISMIFMVLAGKGNTVDYIGIAMSFLVMGAAVAIMASGLAQLAGVANTDGIWAATFAMIVLAAALAAILTALSVLPKSSTIATMAGVFVTMGIGVAILAAGLTTLVSAVADSSDVSSVFVAVAAISLLLLALGGLAALASIPYFTVGFKVISGLFLSLGATAALFALGVSIIVSAVMAFKDAILDIADNAEKFKKGVKVVFVSVAEAIQESVPLILDTLMSAVGGIVKFILELIVTILKELNDKSDDIISQIMISLLKLINGLRMYIGPLVATLFDFIVDLVEGVAYAINTRGGKLVAALFDLMASIIVLTNEVIATILSSIFHFVHLDGIGEWISGIFTNLSKETVKSFAAAGDDAIKQAEKVSAEVVKSSPRLAEYYERYAGTIEESIENGTDGIETALTNSGDGISGLMSGLFGGEGLSSLLNTDSINMDPTSLLSFGESSGINFSEGLQNGLTAFSTSDMFPSVDEFYNAGAEAAEASQSGYAKALYTGLTTGKFKTLKEVSEYIQTHNLENDASTEGLYEAIEEGTVKNLNQAIAFIDANKAKMADKQVQEDAEKLFNEVYKSESNKFKIPEDSESGKVNQRDPIIESYFEMLADMPELIKDRDNLNEETANGLWALREALSKYGYSEYATGVKVIDYLMGLSDELPTGAELKAMRALHAETEKKLVEDAQRVVDEETKRQEEEKLEEFLQALKNSGLSHKAYGSSLSRKMVNKTIADVYGDYSQLQKDIYGYMTEDLEEYTDPKERDERIMYWARVAGEEGSWNEAQIKGFYNSMKTMLGEIEYAKGRITEMTPLAGDLFASYGEASEKGATSVVDYYDNMIVELAEKVPQAVQKFNETFGDTIEVPSIDWSAIINDPASISEEAFTYLMSYMYLLGGQTSDQFIAGLTEAFRSKPKEKVVTKAVSDFSSAIPKAAKDTLQIKSPSKVGEEIGGFFVQGVANGISKSASEAGDESADAGVTMWQRLKDAISSAVGMDLNDLNPVIRPILDLSDIINGSDQINALLGNGQIYRRGTGLGIGPVGYGDLNAIAQMNKTGLAQAIQESVLTQPVNQTLNNTFNIQSNDPNEVARRVSAILSSQVQRKQQVWGPAKVNRATQ